MFCRIYIVFREEASLVDMFSLEILYHLLASLRLSEMDNINSFQNSASSASTLSSSSIVCTAIDHWKKIILKSMDLLLAPNERRMSFPPLMQQLDATASGSSSSHSLDACIAWLFVESGRPFGEYSRKCLELFMELQSRKAPPVRDWLDIQLAKNPNLLVSTFESSEGPNVTIPKLVAAFDVYITLVSQRIIPVSQTFTALTCGSPSSPPPLRQLSPFPSSPVLFVKSIVFLTEIIKFSNINNELEVDSCRALDRFRDRGFLTDAFFDRLAACCFNPESVFGSSNEGDVATSDRFSNLIRQVVSKLSLLKSSNHPVYQKFVQAITSLYSSTKSVILLRKPPILFKIKDISFFNGVSLLLNCCKQALVGEWLGSLEWIVTSIAAATATMSSSLSVSSPGGNINEQVLTHLVEICLSHEQLCIMFYRDIMGLITTSSPESFRLSLPKLYPSILTHILNGSAINGGWAGLVKIISDVDIDVEVFGELLSRLIDVLQSSSSKKHLASSRARFINMFKASLTSLQDIFSALANKDQVLFLSIVQRLLHLLLDSSLLGDHLLSLTVAGITSVVQSGSSTPPQIRNMLQILPSLIKPTEQHQHHQKPIISAIQSLVYESKHFPISPVDLQEGSSQAVEYSGFISCLMNVVRVSGNPLLVDILINHTCRVQHHPQLTQAITSCTSFLGNPHPLLDIGLSRLYQPDFPASFKVNTASQLILPLLKACHLSALREFVCSKIKMIMAPLLASREFRNDDDNDISIRCIHLEMIAVFYSRLSMEDLHNKNSRILIAYCDGIPPSVDNILTKDVTRVTHESKRKIAGSALSYCQSAHNALSAAISCTQTEERFYTAFLFMENESKNEAIWENIVPCQETWNFVKVQFLSDLFGSTNSNSSATKFSGSSVFSSSTSQMSYMSSQYLKHSSLSTVPLSQEGNLSLQDETVSVENVTSAPTLSLPQTDFINRHPCMQTICEIVKKLGGMINVDGDDALPGWMSKLLEKIQATGKKDVSNHSFLL